MQDGNDGNNQDGHHNIDEELQLKAVASEVVQNVLRQAPHAAMERLNAEQQQLLQQRLGELGDLPEDGEEEENDEFGDLPPPPVPEVSQTKYGNRPLQRLPTIQIDTVPSPPRSPPEWPSPPPEAASIKEEDEDELREDHIELSFDDEQSGNVHKYAENYIENLLDKAVELAGERQMAEDCERARQIAAKVVEDVVSQASESASRKSAASLVHAESLPTIQIDTVASLPPSPESVNDEDRGPPNDGSGQDKHGMSRGIPEITYDFSEDIRNEDDDDELQVEKITEDVPQKPRPVKFKDAPKQLQEFAKSYIKDVIARAVTTAEEKAVQSSPFNFDDADLMKTNGPWYIRVREAFIRVLRTACFCTPRRNDS